MSIATEISRIQSAKTDIKTAIEAKGVTVPSSATIDTYATYVSQISGGGGGTDLSGIIDRTISGSLTVPSGITSIGNYAFAYCTSLSSIEIPNSVTSIGNNAFYNCEKLINVTIPNSVTSIGDKVFFYCTSLSSVTIPNSVTSIGGNAFYYCEKLINVTIPNSVTSIGGFAFGYCTSLSSIAVNAETPPTLGKNVFNGSNCPIYVPAESVDAYKSATNWSTYASRIQAIPT